MNSIYENAYAKAKMIVKQKIMEAKDLTEDSDLLEDLVVKKADLIAEVAEKIVDKSKEKVNDKFASKFGGREPKKEVKHKHIEILSKFDEEVEGNTPAYQALVKKAESNDIPVEIIGEVYDRGWRTWNEDVHAVSQQQYAFARVNSYINQGKTYFKEDADLVEFQANMILEDQYEGKYLHTTSDHKGDHGSGYVTGYDTKKKGNVILTVNIGQGVRSKNDNPTKDISVHPKHLTPDWKKSYMVKEGVELDEGTMKPYVKPHIEKGSTKQSAWKAANKYGKVRYFGMDFKSAAEKHAGLNEETLEEAKSLASGINHLGKAVFDKRNGKTGVVQNSYSNGSHSIKWKGSKSPTIHDWAETKAHIRIATSSDEHKKYIKEETLNEAKMREVIDDIDQLDHEAFVRKYGKPKHKVKSELKWMREPAIREEAEQIDELSQDKLERYRQARINSEPYQYTDKYDKHVVRAIGKIHDDDAFDSVLGRAEDAKVKVPASKKRHYDVQKGEFGKFKEEVEQIDELSAATLASYKSKASKEANDLNDTATAHNFLANKHSGSKLGDIHSKKSLAAWAKAKQREKGVAAADKAVNREVGTTSLADIYKNTTPGQSVKESVTAAEKVPVVVPAHKDQYGNTIPAKTVMRKSQRHIMSTGNVHDGKGE